MQHKCHRQFPKCHDWKQPEQWLFTFCLRHTAKQCVSIKDQSPRQCCQIRQHSVLATTEIKYRNGCGAPLRRSWRCFSFPLDCRVEVKIHWKASSIQSVFLCGHRKVVSEQRPLFLLNDWVGPWDLWCWRLTARMPFIFSNDKPHSLFKNPSRRHLANNGLENDRLKRDYFWCSIPWGGHYLVLLFLFTWHRRLSSLQKKIT